MTDTPNRYPNGTIRKSLVRMGEFLSTFLVCVGVIGMFGGIVIGVIELANKTKITFLPYKQATDCRDAIARNATSAMRWTDKPLESAFPSRMPGRNGTLVAAGDKAELQNRYGNWVQAKYLCEYLPDGRVTGAFIEPGWIIPEPRS